MADKPITTPPIRKADLPPTMPEAPVPRPTKETHWLVVGVIRDKNTGEVFKKQVQSAKSVPPGLGRLLVESGDFVKIGESEQETPTDPERYRWERIKDRQLPAGWKVIG